jgi:hypothetical protein
MRDGTRSRQSGVLRWLGVLVAIAAPLALNVSPAAAAADGVGTASARGTDPDARLGSAATTTAQFSAITNCDETQNTRPFIVRWTENGTSHTFRRTSTSGSICSNDGISNRNQGFGEGIIDGSLLVGLSWFFQDSPDSVDDSVAISVGTAFGSILDINADPPAALNGTPGGVWAFGTLPWPVTLPDT